MSRLFSRLLCFSLFVCTCGPALITLSAQTDIPFSYPTSYISTVLDVHVAPNGSGLLGGTCGVLRETADSGQSWTVTEAPENNDLQSVACPPSGCATALLATNTALYRRSGGDWTAITYADYRGGGVLHWLSETLVVNEAGSAGLWRSVDAGLSWTYVPYGQSKDANLFFVDANTGYLFAGQELLVTTDGGATFSPVGYTHPEFVEYLTWLDNSTGWLFDGDRKFWGTTDGGASWTLLNEDQQLSSINWFAALTTDHLVASQGITKAVSTDGGATWTREQYGVDQVKRVGLNFHREGTAFYLPGAENQLLYTPAGFTDFTDLEGTPRQARITDLTFATDEIGYAAAGIDLNVTTDAGATWTVKTLGAIIREIGTLPGGDLVVMTDREALRSSDRGETFINLFSAGVVPEETEHPDVMAVVPGGTVYLMGPNYGYRSTDGGASFTVHQHDLDLRPTAMYFTDDNLGFVVDRNGRFATTADGGHSWSAGTDVPLSGMETILFLNRDTGFVASASRRYVTQDGGQSWELPADLNGGYDFRHRAADGALYAARWDGVGENSLVRSRDNGETWSALAANCFVYRCLALTPNERYVFVAGDGFIVRHDLEALLTSTENAHRRQPLRLLAYPNPSTGNFWIALPAAQHPGDLAVYDGMGRIVTRQTTPAGQARVAVELGEFPAGVYSVRWQAGNGKVGQVRLVKQ